MSNSAVEKYFRLEEIKEMIDKELAEPWANENVTIIDKVHHEGYCQGYTDGMLRAFDIVIDFPGGETDGRK